MSYPDIIVAGAGTSTVNGTYVENGTLNGKPLYIMQGQVDYPRIYFDPAGAWFIYAFNSYKGHLYYSNESVDTPDLCTTWNVSSWGTSPAPTVTAASSGQNLTLTCAAGSYSLTGTNADLTVKRNYVLACEAGSYSVTGTNADITSSRTLVCDSASGGAYPDIIVSGAGTSDANGTWTYAGESFGKPYYTLGENVFAWIGSFWAINGYYYSYDDVATPDLVTTWTVYTSGIVPVPTVTADAATTYVLTGSDVTLTYTQGAQNLTLTCEAGSYSLTGTDATLTAQYNYTLTCEAGAYTLTGSSVSFVIQHNYTFVCETGSYSLTGTDADLVLLRNYILACETGSYALTGTDTALTSARTMACNAGSYTLTGTNAGLYRALVMACNAGSYALTGSDVTINSNRIFALGMGSYVLVGTSVGLFILTPTPACRTATIEYENRTFAIPHENRTATIEYENRTLEVTCH